MNLHEKYHEETIRLPNVLLGVASAAIAFAFHETSDRQLTFSLIPTALAVIAWSLSFAAGVLFSRAYTLGLKGNIALNEADKAAKAAWKAEAQAMFDEWNKKAGRRYAAQQWLLLVGALFYGLGHTWFLIEQESSAQPSEQQRSMEGDGNKPARLGQLPIEVPKVTATAHPPPAPGTESNPVRTALSRSPRACTPV